VGDMTLQYLAGELSERLGELQTLGVDESSAGALRRLRREAETCPPEALRSVTVRALALADGVCWHLLDMGDAATFTREAAACAGLHEFGLCAGLLDED
jgi:hypothetical protein